MSKRDPIKGFWCGVDVWRCPLCAYDSEQETKTRDHIDAAHPLPPPEEVTRLVAEARVEIVKTATLPSNVKPEPTKGVVTNG